MNIYMPAAGVPPPVVTDAAIGASLPAMLLQRAAERGGRVIMRKKDRGIWKEITWAQLAARARHVGMGMAALGFAAGERAAILSETGPNWVCADLGILGAGGVSVGIHPTASPEQVADTLRDCGATLLFVENEEQLDKALAARAACPQLRRIVIFGMTGLRDLDDPMCESFEALVTRGAAHDGAHPGAWEAGIAAIAGEDLALLIYTSGSTGAPKGVMLSHRNILVQIVNAAAVLDQREGDERLAFLPMGHVAERVLGFYLALYTGTISNYAEDPDTALANLREVQPTVQLGVPRFWERFHSRTSLAVADATWLQRAAYRWAIGVGRRRAEARLAGRSASGFLAVANWIGYWLALRNIRRQIGIDRLRWGLVGGAPVSPELIGWYLALGIELRAFYGMTECAGLAACTPVGAIRPDSAGMPVPYGEIALSPEGEIVMRGEHVFRGYWNQPALTGMVLREGWLHSGDTGAVEDGVLRVADRMADVIVTAHGRTIAPAEIETALTFSPYIADAMVIGEGRKFLGCLLMMDHETVEKWAQDKSVPFTSFASLIGSDAVRALIEAELARVNAGTARVTRIEAFRVIDRKLAPEDPELTPAMKLRRGFVQERYAALIETMYADA